MAGPTPDDRLVAQPEESLDDLYEHAPCGYLSTLADGTIVRVNQTFLDWTGYAREELISRRRFQELLTRGGQIYHETHLAPLLRMQAEVRSIALQIERADGSRIPVLVTSVLRTRPESGEAAVVRTAVVEAGDRRAYEEELLRARRREQDARERVERLQRLTARLAGNLDAREIADATLAAATEDLGPCSLRIEAPEMHVEIHEGRSLVAAETFELVASDRVVGRLAVDPEGRRLDEAERAFLLACAQQCAQALERAALHARTARDAERAALLAELAQTLEERRSYAERARRLVELLAARVADTASVVAPGHEDIAAGRGPDAVGAVHALELPLHGRTEALGALVVRRSTAFDADDRRLLADVADRAALALDNARLYEHEHHVADSLQRSMLTQRLPTHPRFALAAHYQPAVRLMTVGGDWYDAFTPQSGRLTLVVGDVVGRGIEAATAMGQLRSAARALAAAVAGPAELLDRLDEFAEHVDIAGCSTLVCADLDLAARTLRYACAGHPPPALVESGGGARFLWDGRSTPIATFVGLGTRSQAEIVLPPGARLLLYTDGLIERRDRPLEQGLDALLAALTERRDIPIAALVRELPPVLLEGGPDRDDVCLLGLALDP